MWNLRLECGQRLSPTAMRTTEFAPALESSPVPVSEPASVSEPVPAVVYGPPKFARQSFTGGFPGSAFTLQPDGSLRCPANHPLYPQERRPERDGSYRLLYAARIGDCRACQFRAKCQESPSTSKPRRVSAVFWPLLATPASAPLAPFPELPSQALEPIPRLPVLWRDWPRCHLRRNWMRVTRTELVTLTMGEAPTKAHPIATDAPVITRPQRAHYRLTWDERFVRNARPSAAQPLTVTLHGLPDTFVHVYGFALLAVA